MEQSLDIEQHDQLIAYLRDAKRIGGDEQVTCRTLAGGVSNRTVLVERPSGESWVLKQALAKLRVKVDWFSDPARVHREALALEYLPHLTPAGSITPLVFEDEANHLLAMEAVPQPHENWKTMLLAARLENDHLQQFARLLYDIHHGAPKFSDTLSTIFGDRSFFESLRLEPYYAYTAQQVPEAREFLMKLIDDTRARRLTLVHGDFSPKNILVHAGRLILLDHEVIHWGDPAFDAGFAITHLLSKAHHLHDVRFLHAVEQFYLHIGREDHDMRLRHTLACMLARVAGRSTLEYLDEPARQRQREAIVHFIEAQLESMDDLLQACEQRLVRRS